MTIQEFQRLIEQHYLERDSARGLFETFTWFTEEVGELARALHRQGEEELRSEFADVLAWLSTLASLTGVDLEEAAAKYYPTCPKCQRSPCACPLSRDRDR